MQEGWYFCLKASLGPHVIGFPHWQQGSAMASLLTVPQSLGVVTQNTEQLPGKPFYPICYQVFHPQMICCNLIINKGRNWQLIPWHLKHSSCINPKPGAFTPPCFTDFLQMAHSPREMLLESTSVLMVWIGWSSLTVGIACEKNDQMLEQPFLLVLTSNILCTSAFR